LLSCYFSFGAPTTDWSTREPGQECLAQIDVQLKRRYDLIPNLVETVKGYKNFERDTLEAVTKAAPRHKPPQHPAMSELAPQRKANYPEP